MICLCSPDCDVWDSDLNFSVGLLSYLYVQAEIPSLWCCSYIFLCQEEHSIILFDQRISILFLVNVEQLWGGTRGPSASERSFLHSQANVDTFHSE